MLMRLNDDTCGVPRLRNDEISGPILPSRRPHELSGLEPHGYVLLRIVYKDRRPGRALFSIASSYHKGNAKPTSESAIARPASPAPNQSARERDTLAVAHGYDSSEKIGQSCAILATLVQLRRRYGVP